MVNAEEAMKRLAGSVDGSRGFSTTLLVRIQA